MKDQFGVGARLRKLRGEQSQKAFAEKIGVPLSTYQRYEGGTRIPPPNVITQIASACAVPADIITKGTFGFYEFVNEARGRKGQKQINSEILATGLLKYVERHPKLFDQMVRILEEGDWKKTTALKSLLRSLDPSDRVTAK